MKQVVILNAPPMSGKDTIADLMVKHLKATKREFKESLYEAFAEHYRMPLNLVKGICTNRETKDTLLSYFSEQHGITPRQGLIYVSEEVYKPNFGMDYFGQQAANKLISGVNVFSDGGGWWSELAPIVYKSDRVLVCRLYRNGYDFSTDSRDYYDEDTMPDDIKSGGKLQLCDIHLEENKPYVALDAIARILKENL
jgi:hypothetical protein